MKKIDVLKKIQNVENEIQLLVTVVKLPNGAYETIVNYQSLGEKLDYLINAYDEDMKLKTCNAVELVDCIIL
jgi:hypothetical protein